MFRRSEYCQDVSYWSLKEHLLHTFSTCGREYVEYRRALEKYNERYGFGRIITDCGSTLCGVLLEQGLVNMISLVIPPAIIGKESAGLLRKTGKPCLNLEPLRQETFSGGHLHVLYRISEQ